MLLREESFMRMYLTVLWILLIIITGCTNHKNATFETISIDTILDKQQQGYILLDVREAHEFQKGHIQDAQNKPYTALKLGQFDGLNKEQKYIVICRSGSRSEDASSILTSNGFHVLNVDKGMNSWQGDIVK